MLTRSGAKLLDFGLAKSASVLASPDGETQQKSITAEGTIVGTFQYMAPEQLEGIEADARTDIFALGATFYEMLTGRRAFARDTPVETLGAVLRDDPRDHVEAKKIPEALQPFVFRALEKDAADRYQSARDLLLDLRAWQAERISKAAERVQFRSEPPWKHRRTRVLLRTVGGVVLFILGLWAGSCWERGRGTGSGAAGKPIASARP